MGDSGAVVRTVGGIAERGMQITSDQIIASQNRKLQREFNKQQQSNWQNQFDYQKSLNNMQMQREDNAIQRSVADHQKAGFNKLLAVGNQSAAGGMTTFGGNAGGEAPRGESSDFTGLISQIGENMMQAKLNNAMVSKTYAEASYTRQKELTEVENTAWTNIKTLREKLAKEKDEKMKDYWQNEIDEQLARIDLARKNAGLSQAKTDEINYNVEKSKEEGLRTNDAKDTKYNSTIAAGNVITKKIKEGSEESKEIKNRKDDKFQDAWDEGIHRNEHGEVIYEVFYDKRKKKLKRVWKNGDVEYKGY